MTTLILRYLKLTKTSRFDWIYYFELLDTDYPRTKEISERIIVLFQSWEMFSLFTPESFPPLGNKEGNIFQFTFASDKFNEENYSSLGCNSSWRISLSSLIEAKDITDTFPAPEKELIRIRGKLGNDLSDTRLEELKNSCDLLPEFQGQLSEAKDTIDTLQSQLIQTQSERDDYQSKWDSSQEELEQKQEIIRQLVDKSKVDHEEFEKALDKSKEWHENQKKENLDFFLKIQTKQKELKELKKSTKIKLEIEVWKSSLSTLLISQEQVIRLQGSSHLVSLNEKQLNKVKKSLSEKLTNEEINKLCSLQSELTKLEMKMEQMRDELQAKIEVNNS